MRKFIKKIIAKFKKGEMPLKVGDRVALDKERYKYYYFIGIVESYNPKKKKYKVYFPNWHNGIHWNLTRDQIVKR